MKKLNTQEPKNFSLTHPEPKEKEISKAEEGPLKEKTENLEAIPFELESLNSKDKKKLNLLSIIESLLFASQKPLSFHQIKKILEEEEHKITASQIKEALNFLLKKYQSKESGVSLEEVSNGFQIRTKPLNAPYIKRLLKTKTFKLSTAALEVLSIVAYKEPCIKANVDELRGVESGHLLRTLMEKGLIQFLRKSEHPGRPMLYGTTKKFLEIFKLKSLKDLPSLHEMEELSKKDEKRNLAKENVQQNFKLFKNKIEKTSLFEKEIQKRKKREDQDEKFLNQVSSQLSNLQIQPSFLETKNPVEKNEEKKESKKK